MNAMYLSPEPLLQEPLYVLGEHLGGFTTPAYAYARNNPIGYIDPDGLRPGDRFTGRWAANRSAMDALEFINPTSIKNNWEYGGTICYEPGTRSFFATPPQTDKSADSCSPEKSPCPPGTFRYAEYHTHAAANPKAKDERFSFDDKWWPSHPEHGWPYNSYLATPGGRFLKYYHTGRQTQLWGPK